MTPLNSIHNDCFVKIVRIDAGWGLSRQLSHMGLFVGDTIKVIQNSQGPLIVAKGNLRLALGRGMSHKIFVIQEN